MPRRHTGKTKITACPHKQRKHYAKGKCHSCYTRDQAKAREALNLSKPEVAGHVANAVIKSKLDVEHAVKYELAPEGTPGERYEMAQKIKQSPEVQEAIEKGLQELGLDENSKNEFVKEMWAWLKGDEARLQMCAAKILGRGFIGEKIDDKRPMELKISGFEEGLKQMLGKPDGQPEGMPSGNDPVLDEEGEEDEDVVQ